MFLVGQQNSSSTTNETFSQLTPLRVVEADGVKDIWQFRLYVDLDQYDDLRAWIDERQSVVTIVSDHSKAISPELRKALQRSHKHGSCLVEGLIRSDDVAVEFKVSWL